MFRGDYDEAHQCWRRSWCSSTNRGREVLRAEHELFTDASGNIIEDSTHRLVGNLAARFRYVLSKDYLTQPQFQQWRARQMARAP